MSLFPSRQNSEHEREIRRLEDTSRELRSLLATKDLTIAHQRLQLVQAEHRYQKLLEAFLEVVTPRQQPPVAVSPSAALREPTPAEIRAEPAHSKREMDARERRAREAEARQKDQTEEHKLRERNELLTTEEKREMDLTMGVFANDIAVTKGEEVAP